MDTQSQLKDVNVKGKDLTLEEVTFQDNDRKVSFNTGLAMWTVFKSRLTFILSGQPKISLSSLAKVTKYVMKRTSS